MRRKPAERAMLQPMVLFDPNARGLTRTLTGQHRAYVELMGRQPPPDHPSGQFSWKPKGAKGTPARVESVLDTVAGDTD